MSAEYGLSEFLVCLLQLRQLSSLDLSPTGGGHMVGSLAEIVQVSEFTALTSLHLRSGAACMSVEYSSEQSLHLDRLKGLLGPGVLQS